MSVRTVNLCPALLRDRQALVVTLAQAGRVEATWTTHGLLSDDGEFQPCPSCGSVVTDATAVWRPGVRHLMTIGEKLLRSRGQGFEQTVHAQAIKLASMLVYQLGDELLEPSGDPIWQTVVPDLVVDEDSTTIVRDPTGLAVMVTASRARPSAKGIALLDQFQAERGPVAL